MRRGQDSGCSKPPLSPVKACTVLTVSAALGQPVGPGLGLGLAPGQGLDEEASTPQGPALAAPTPPPLTVPPPTARPRHTAPRAIPAATETFTRCLHTVE